MLRDMAVNWWALLLRGLAAIAFGVLALLLPRLAFLSFVLLFGIYALVDGIGALVQAFRTREGRWLSLLEGLISVAAGAIALLQPNLAGLTIVLVVALWAILTGVMEIVAAIRLRAEIDNEWFLALSGLLSIVFGVIAFFLPDVGALTLVTVAAIYAILFGVLLIALALRLRRANTTTTPTSTATPA